MAPVMYRCQFKAVHDLLCCLLNKSLSLLTCHRQSAAAQNSMIDNQTLFSATMKLRETTNNIPDGNETWYLL